jgi:hypothetical protein
MALLLDPTKPSKPSKKKNSATSCREKGKSGNPAGRPLGSRNKSTLLLGALLGNEAEPLTRKMIQAGLKGDPMALRFCLERLLPRRRGRPIQLPLRDLSPASALKLILATVGEGEITPEEGEIVANIVGKQMSIEAEDMLRRISKLEKTLAKTSDKTNSAGTVSDDDDDHSEAQSSSTEDTSVEENTTAEPEVTLATDTSPAGEPFDFRQHPRLLIE